MRASTRRTSNVLLFVLSCLLAGAPYAAAVINESGAIASDTTWANTDVHLVTGDITVNSGVVLTIQAGTIVKFNSGRRIYTNGGAIKAEGTVGNEIIFTSYRDDSYGGDTNGNGASTGVPGDWNSLHLSLPANTFTFFKYCIFRYGGSSGIGNLYIEQGNFTVENCLFELASNYGSYIYNCSPSYTNCVFQNNAFHGIISYYCSSIFTTCQFLNNTGQGARINYSGAPTFTGCTISGNEHGIYADNSQTPTITNNIITGNLGWGVYFPNNTSAPVLTGNTITGNQRALVVPVSAFPSDSDGNVLAPNTYNVLYIRGGTRSTDLTLNVKYEGTPYEINSYYIDNSYYQSNGTTLAIEPGVNVKFTTNAELNIYGTLRAKGLENRRITFTTYYDDFHGGDSNADNYATGPYLGAWNGIRIEDSASDADCQLSYCNVLYAGNNGLGGLYMNANTLRLDHCVFASNKNQGMYVSNAQPRIWDCEFWGNSGHGIYIYYYSNPPIQRCRSYGNNGWGIYNDYQSNPAVNDGEIFGNLSGGFYNNTGYVPDLNRTWWGAPDGPSGNGPGSGDSLAGNPATITPFLTAGTEYSFLDAGPNTLQGTLAPIQVLQGTPWSDWGSSAGATVLYDSDQVKLGINGLNPATTYLLGVIYYNADDTSGIGGNKQSLEDGAGNVIHGIISMPSSAASTYFFDLGPASYADGNLQLRFVRENGFRATVSAVWVMEKTGTGDTQAPVSAIKLPADGVDLSGSFYKVVGSAAEQGGGLVTFVEFGVKSGGATTWNPATSVNLDGNWTYFWTLPSDGVYSLMSRAVDNSGNREIPSDAVTVRINNAPPRGIFNLVAWDVPADSGGTIHVQWTKSPDDGAGANDVTGYTILRQAGSARDYVEIGNVGTGVEQFNDTTAVDGTLYYYQVQTNDSGGNQVVSSSYGPVVSVANDGSDTTPPAEVTNLVGTPGNAFVILSWTSPPLATNPDFFDHILDISVDGGITWGANNPAYDDGQTLSLGKTRAYYTVTGLTNSTPYQFRLRTKDSSGNLSSGAIVGAQPETTAALNVSGTIATDTVWAAGTFRVTGDITINSGVTLTILPGVLVKFNAGRSMTNNGILVADGTSGSPIVFTSIKDDAHGGDTNADGNATLPNGGDWGQIRFSSSANTTLSVLNYCQFLYGGNTGRMLHFDSSPMTLQNSVINRSNYDGLYIYNAAANILNSSITNCNRNGVEFYGSGANGTVSGSTFSGCTQGLFMQASSAPTLTNNTITGNSSYGVYANTTGGMAVITGNTITGNGVTARLPFSALPDVAGGNTLTPNTRNIIEVQNNTLSQNRTLGVYGGGALSVYSFVNGTSTVASGVVLTVQPGVTLKFTNGNMNVNGALNAVTTTGNPIVFTSYRDDSAGGDSNGDGTSSGARGDWGRIFFSDSVIDFLCILENCQFRYGGSNGEGLVRANRSVITLQDCRLEQSSTHGVYLDDNAHGKILGCTITNNSSYGIYNYYYCSPLIQDSNISYNGSDGIRIEYACTPTIQNCTISHNVNGILNNHNWAATVTDCSITGNSNWGIYFSYNVDNNPVISGCTITGNLRSMIVPLGAVPNASDGNTLAPNTYNGLWIRGGNRSTGLTLDIKYPGQPYEMNTYVFYETSSFTNGARLVVNPGVYLKFNDSALLYIYGGLKALGTAQNPVIFTSYKDDEAGGDFNVDGTASGPSMGIWQGIRIESSSNDADLQMDYCHMRFGGGNGLGNLYVNVKSFPISNSSFQFSRYQGLYSSNASLRVYSSDFIGNGDNGFYDYYYSNSLLTDCRFLGNQGSGVYSDYQSLTAVTLSQFMGNIGYGYYNNSGREQTATDNWWGAADGPSGSGIGTGDQVGSSVTYEPFAATGPSFSFFDAGPNTAEGSLPAPVVVNGTPSTEWGNTAWTNLLYEVTSVVLDYHGLDPAKRYFLGLVYLNDDNTSGIGGNKQNLTAGDGTIITDTFYTPATNATFFRTSLPGPVYLDGNVQLRFNRKNGFRAVVSAVSLFEDVKALDLNAPFSTITAPVADEVVTGASYTVTGTSSDPEGSRVTKVEVSVRSGGAPTWNTAQQLHGDGTWTFTWTLPADGRYTLQSRATDESGNLEIPGMGVAVSVNNTPPNGITALTAWDKPSDNGGAIEVSWAKSADDGAGVNDVFGYNVERREGTTGSFAQVGNVPAGTESYTDSTTTDGVTYYYRVVTVDLGGNTATSPLYGPVSSADNLGGGDTTPPEDVTSLTAIPGSEFVFLQWTASADSAHDLYRQLLDISLDGGTTYGANAPTFDDGQTFDLGKVVTNRLVSSLTNGTLYRFRVRTQDSTGNTSAGATVDSTPSAGAFTNVSGTISTDTTWQAGIFRVTGDITVNAGVTLTIAPGVIVKFNASRRMTVNGTLVADGTALNPIIFTSIKDDANGGDTNGDGNATTPAAGNWNYIQLSNGAYAAQTVFRHCQILYAGNGGMSLYLVNTSPALSSILIAESTNEGIEATGSSFTLENGDIQNCAGAGIYLTSNSHASLQGTSVSGCVYGLRVSSSVPTVADNSFTGNSSYGIYYNNSPANVPPITGNVLTGNGTPARLPFSSVPSPSDGNILAPNTKAVVEVLGNTVSTDKTLGVYDSGLPTEMNTYLFVSGANSVSTGILLTVEPGVNVKFSGTYLTIYGGMYAVGTASERIVFTSYRDDTAGGDTNNDGPSSGVAGDWGRIYFDTTAAAFLCRLDYCDFRYGGSTGEGNVLVYNLAFNITNSTFNYSSNYGFYSYNNAQPSFTNCTFNNNTNYGFYTYYLCVNNFQNCTFNNNGSSGAYIDYACQDTFNTCTFSGNVHGIYNNHNWAQTITNCTITNNSGWGIYYVYNVDGNPVLMGNTITGNQRALIVPSSAFPNDSDGNVLAPNTYNHLWLRGGYRSTDLDLNIKYPGQPYEINTYVLAGYHYQQSGSSIFFQPGILAKFYDDGYLEIQGGMKALGTEMNPIVFTSYRDDRYGGDTNLNGNGDKGYAGVWRGIYVTGGASSADLQMDYCDVRFGGSNGSGGLTVISQNFPVSNSTFAENWTQGIYTNNGSLRITNCQLFGNTGQGLYVYNASPEVNGGRAFANYGSGIYNDWNSNSRVTGIEMFGNLEYGLYNNSGFSLNARGNWWGAQDGPGGSGSGSGDEVSGNVDFNFILTDGTEFSFFDAGGTSHYGYGIAQPNGTGIASSQWGADPANSFLYDASPDKRVTVEYNGLSTANPYQLLVGYRSSDSQPHTQTITDGLGLTIQDTTTLPTSPMTWDMVVSPASIQGGVLQLNFNGIQGFRSLVNTIWLVKKTSTDQTPPLVAILNPPTGALLPAGIVNVNGTASDADTGIQNVSLGVYDGASTTWRTVDSFLPSAGTWSTTWTATTGVYSLYARAIDEAGNAANSLPGVLVTIDGVAPAAPIGLTAQAKSGTADTILLYWTPSSDDGSGANDVVGYGVYRATVSSGPFTHIADVNAGMGTFEDGTATEGINFWYYVRAEDAAGNGSNSNTAGPVQSSSATDTTPPENVTGFTATPMYVDLNIGAIFLAWTGSVNSEVDLVDQRLYISLDGTTWGTNAPAYDDGNFISLGKLLRRYQVTSIPKNILHYFKITVVDEVPNESTGATASTTFTGSPSQVLTLGGTLSVNAHILQGVVRITTDLTVSAGYTLTLDPGVIVKFNDGRRFNIYGNLVAVGTLAQPIIFTSIRDDSKGGDTNANGSANAPSRGIWAAVRFFSSPASQLAYCQFSYAGGDGYTVYQEYVSVPLTNCLLTESSTRALYLYQANATVTGSTFSNCSSDSAYIQSSTTTITNTQITNCSGYGIYYYGGSSSVENCQITNNGNHGLYFYANGYGTVRNNTITGNGGYGVYYHTSWAPGAPMMTGNTITGNARPVCIPASAMPDTTNTLVPNTANAIDLIGNSLLQDTTMYTFAGATRVDPLVVYRFITGALTVPNYMTLTMMPSVVVKFYQSTNWNIYGALNAVADLSHKIHFSSWKDDLAGGDSNVDSGNSSPQNGDWYGLFFYDSFLTSHLQYCEIKYSGEGGNPGIYVNDSDTIIENCEISNSANEGIRFEASDVVFNGNNVWGNSGAGVRFYYGSGAVNFGLMSSNGSYGIWFDYGSSGTVNNCQIFSNREYGFYNNGAPEVDATNNWWGDSDGSGPAPSGTGDAVYGSLNFTPYLTTIGVKFSYYDAAETPVTKGYLPVPALVNGVLSDEWDASSKRPDRTMAYAGDTEGNVVTIRYSDLNAAKTYLIRTSYFNQDPNGAIQSLRDGNDNIIHAGMQLPTSSPTQFEFDIPSPYYADGNLVLNFTLDNPDTAFRATLTEAWLMESVPEFTPPQFVSILYNDKDGSGTLTEGDEYSFVFSEEMDVTRITNGTTDANTKLVPAGNLLYGTTNTVRWSADNKIAIVTVSAGFTITGNELVTPSSEVVDLAGNPVVGTQSLSLIDKAQPVLLGITWNDNDSTGGLSLGDSYTFSFDERMKTSVIQTGTTNANVHLRPAGGKIYGTVNTLSWSGDGRQVTVDVTAGYTIRGDELVTPSSFVTDVAGNRATGSDYLEGRDNIAPQFTAAAFNDRDGNGIVSLGDQYVFSFSEAIDSSAISNGTTEANLNLSPEGALYGTTNTVSWNGAKTAVTVTITAGFSITGTELVTPSVLLTDLSGNPVTGTQNLTLTDTIDPTVLSASISDPSPVKPASNITFTFVMSESMDTGTFPAIDFNLSSMVRTTVPGGGTYTTTTYPNDTYTSPQVDLTGFGDGNYTVQAGSGTATDVGGNLLTPGGAVLNFLLDGTPPSAPNVTSLTSGDFHIDMGWMANPEPDIVGYRLSWGNQQSVYSNVIPLGKVTSYHLAGLPTNSRFFLVLQAVDNAGNVGPMSPEQIIFTGDVVAPPTIQNLTVTPGDTDATLTWSASSAGDILKYKVYWETNAFNTVSGLTNKAEVAPGTTNLLATGLTNGTTYYFAVTAMDTHNNEETSVNSVGATPQNFPPKAVTGFTAVPGDMRVTLNWNATTVYDFLKYQIFRDTTGPITSVAERTPVTEIMTAATNSYVVSGLTENITHYFAIVVVDTASQVGAISATSTYLPRLRPVLAITAPLNGAVVTRPMNFTATATDPQGINRVEFFIDQNLVFSDTTSPYQYFWDITQPGNGQWRLQAIAYDNAAFSADQQINVLVAGVAPSAPSIRYPANNAFLNTNTIAIKGRSELGTTVTVYRNNSFIGQTATNVDGNFTLAGAVLNEGANSLQASAADNLGASNRSAAITVTVDTGAPTAPLNLVAAAAGGGAARLTWDRPTSQDENRFRIYRHTASFTSTGEATLAQDNVTSRDVTDTPPSDGLWFYGVTALDYANNESPLSNIVWNLSDRVAPSGTLVWNPAAPLAPGDHNVALTLSEQAGEPPYLALRPSNGSLTAIALAKDTNLTWHGRYLVMSSTPHGTADLTFSVRDRSNNRGTALLSGPVVAIDTRGPVGRITLSKQPPIGLGDVGLSLYLDEPAVGTPTLSFTSPGTRSIEPITLTGADQNWTGTLTITESMFSGTGQFAFSATDQYGNVSTLLSSGASVEVDVNIPNAPTGLAATVKAGGVIHLNWFGVVSAATYNLYRGVEGVPIDPNLDAPVAMGLTSLSADDTPPLDINYCYAVTAVNAAGNESGLSGLACALPDRVPPNPPAGLTLQAEGSGIRLNWTPPASGEPASSYNVYRELTPIVSLTGLTPVKTFLNNPTALDIPTVDAFFYYAVTANDVARNESGPSNSEGILFDFAAPVITVTGVANNGFYKDPVVPVVHATDTTLDTLTATVDGAPYCTGAPDCSGSPVNTEGRRHLHADAADTEAHTSTFDINFILDFTPPVITINGVTDHGFYESPVTPDINATDLYLVSASATLNGANYLSGTTVSADGNYTLHVQAADRAGNSTVVNWTFQIDGPPAAPPNFTVALSEDLASPPNRADMSWTAHPALDIAGYNIYRDSVKLNTGLIAGLTYADTAYTSGARHTYGLTAVDGRGHESPVRNAVVLPFTMNLNPLTLQRSYFMEVPLTVASTDTQSNQVPSVALTLKESGSTVATSMTNGPWTVPAGSTGTVTGVISTKGESSTSRTIVATLNESSTSGTTVTLSRTFNATVATPATQMEILNDPLLRGGATAVRLRVFNHGTATMQIITAINGQANPGVAVRVTDADGNILGEGNLAQLAGPGVVNYPGFTLVDIAPGTSFTTDPISVSIPLSSPDDVAIQGSVNAIYHRYNFSNQQTGPGLSALKGTTVVDTPYYATAFSDKSLYLQGEVVRIFGQTLDTQTDAPVPNVDVKVGLSVRGFVRYQTVTTNGSGDYNMVFRPFSTEAGVYNLFAVHPLIVDQPLQATFTILGMSMDPGSVSLRMSKNNSLSFDVTLKNLGETALSGLNFSFTPSPGLFGVTGQVNTYGLTSLEAGQMARVRVTILADLNASDTGGIDMMLTTSEGAQKTLAVSLELFAPQPTLRASPSFIEGRVNRADIYSATVKIQNVGFDVLRNAHLELPGYDWMTFNIDPIIGDVGIGESRDIGVIFRPDQNVAIGQYTSSFRILSDNHIPYTINLYATVTSSQHGDLLFHVEDILNEHLQGASVLINNTLLSSYVQTGTTDANGEVRFSDLPEGSYVYKVSAPGHENKVGNIDVVAGIVVPLNVFLFNQFVTVEWSVTPVTIEDRYEITLKTTFQTNVPYPVILVNPPMLAFRLVPGAVFVGEYTLTNYGLLTGKNVNFRPTVSGPISLDLLVEEIDEIPAMQSIKVPYRVAYTGPLPTARAGSDCPRIPGVDCTLSGGILNILEYLCRLESIATGVDHRVRPEICAALNATGTIENSTSLSGLCNIATNCNDCCALLQFTSISGAISGMFGAAQCLGQFFSPSSSSGTYSSTSGGGGPGGSGGGYGGIGWSPCTPVR